MKRIGLVFWHEYWEHLTRKGYLIFTFGFPIFIVIVPLIGGFIMALALYLAAPLSMPSAVGIVDQAGLLTSPAEQTTIHQQGFWVKPNIADIPEDLDPSSNLESSLNQALTVVFIRTPTEAAAALATDKIQVYYVIPANYWESGIIRQHYYKVPNELVEGMIRGWVQQTLSQDVPPALLRRYYQGANIAHTDLAGESRDFSFINFIEGAIVYLVIYFVRLVGTSFTANYMFDSIASESDDRTMEILITSVSPFQFLLGKLFGLLAVGITQLTIWGALGVIVLQFISIIMGVNLLNYLLSWPYLPLLISMLMGAYIMDHLIAAALGLLKVSGGAGMQLFSLVNMFSGFSIVYATYFIPRNPHTFLAILTSLFPLTSPIVLLIRVVVSDVPLWQTILAQLLIWITNFITIFWLLRLLKANLVAYKGRFHLRAWIKSRLRLHSA